MKARAAELAPCPESRRWVVGELVFRSPTFATGARVLNLIARRKPVEDQRLQDLVLEVLPIAGLIAGLCWWHPTLELETPTPAIADEAALLAYGHAVVVELQDAGHDLPVLFTLHNELLSRLGRHQNIVARADEVATFIEPPKDALTA